MTDINPDAVSESEEQLVQRAAQALNHCNWVIGECAARWTVRYARGRTDADFGMQIGLSGDQVYQRRRVWEVFADEYEQFTNLRWSHYYAAVNWEDAADCLSWADQMEATVAQMKAWRRAQHGEDLTEPPEEQPGAMDLDVVPFEVATVKSVPEDGSFEAGQRASGSREGDGNREERHAGVARETGESEQYTPFGNTARGSAEQQQEGGTAVAAPPETATTVKKACSALERVAKVITPELIEEFPSLPPELQKRFRSAIRDVASRAAALED